MDRFAGFNRVKLLGATVIVAIIGAIALAIPAYTDRLRRDQVLEAFQNLSDIQAWMEGFYKHYRNYARGDLCGAAVVPEDRARYFTYACAVDTTAGAAPGQSYKATATGKSCPMAGFAFAIDEKKARATLSIPSDWGALPASAGSIWVDRKGIK